jgi:hypothetical protein
MPRIPGRKPKLWTTGASSIAPPPPPIPIAFTHHVRRGDPAPAYATSGGPLRFTLPNGNVIEIEAYVRPEHSIGLHVRGIDCMLDVETHASNTLIVKPRPEWKPPK